jgi:hypothetical protein
MAGTNPYPLRDLYLGYQCSSRQRQRMPWIARIAIIEIKYLFHFCIFDVLVNEFHDQLPSRISKSSILTCCAQAPCCLTCSQRLVLAIHQEAVWVYVCLLQGAKKLSGVPPPPFFEIYERIVYLR